MAARVVAIANQKGGVGKTTTALSLAAALARLDSRVLLMDLDPHACASIHLSMFPESLEATALDLFDPGREDGEVWTAVVRSAGDAGFDVVPSHIRVADLDVELMRTPSKGLILSRRLEAVRDRYDFVLLDCPPHIGVVLVNALVASDLLLIPIQTDFLALHGLRLIFDTVTTLNRVLRRRIDYRALATMYDRRAGACRRVLDLLRAKLGPRLFETVINLDTQFREASAMGKVIYEVAPASRGAAEYMALAREIATP
jgi:chromosome partitioning protein